MKVQFNADGSLKIPENIQAKKSNPTPDHIKVLRLVNRLEFPVGRKLLAAILHGDMTNQIRQLSLHRLLEHSSLDLYDYKDIYELLDRMLFDNLIEISRAKNARYLPVLTITPKGKKEMENQEWDSTSTYQNSELQSSKVTDQDRERFDALSGFLEGFNDEQKKAIIEPAKNILCIAGAGSGKTTVLTKRIEFLTRLQGIESNKILAITFTRKAKAEMKERLNKLIPGVHVETFNSFCEKLLKKHNDLLYDSQCKVIDFSTKVKLVTKAINSLGYSPEQVVKKYFEKRKNDSPKSQYMSFVNDVYSLMDNYSHNETPIQTMQDMINKMQNPNSRATALLMFNIIQKINEYKKKLNIRDFTDQLLHCLKLFEKHPKTIPNYNHILVDEYQDVNNLQVKLLKELKNDNFFAVGDPRQSIYGWRGSNISYILKFKEDYPDSTIIQLTTNYRSAKSVVNLGNHIISKMELPNLQANNRDNEKITLINHPDEESEAFFIAQSIMYMDIPRNNIFVLSRTNNQIELVSEMLDKHNIKYIKKTIEENNENLEAREDEVTLSTVHAIKGLEAEVVYMIGVNSNMYPCKASEHPVLNSIKLNDDYNKFDEELRLLYVGLTRAKKQLVINYTKKLSTFITKDTEKLLTKTLKKG